MNYSERAIRQFFGDNPTVKTKDSGKSTRYEPVFNLKIPESKKYENEGQWFKDYAEFVMPSYTTVIDDYRELKLAYDVYNDNLEGYKEVLDKFCNPLGENAGQIGEEIIPYPKLHNKINVLKGELIKRNDNHKVILLSAKAIKDKNEQLINAIKASVEEEVQLTIMKMQEQMNGMSPQEADEYIQQLRTQKSPEDLMNKNFQSEWEIFYNRALRLAEHTQNLKAKKLETLEDACVADRFFIYSGWRFGKPHLEIRNTLYSAFQKAPNEMFVHKGDYFAYKKPITITDVYNHYGDYLSQDEIESLGIYTNRNNTRIDKRHALGPHKHQHVFDHTNEEIFRDIYNTSQMTYEDKTIGTHQGQGINRRYNRETLIWETHIEFKAYRHLIFLSYIDDYNEYVTIPMSDEFEIPEDAEKINFVNKWGRDSIKYVWQDPISGTEYTAEELWIPWKYEVIRLGDNIYPIFRAVPHQTINLENPYSDFNLSTFGAILTSRNAKSISLLQRAIPSYFQYLYVKHIQNRELSKYQGFIQDVDTDQVPLQLGQDKDGKLIRDPIAVWLLYRKQLGLNLYSGTQTTTGALPPATRSPGSSAHLIGTAADIFHLQQLLDYIDREIGMAMGISPQREAQFSSGTNVTDNRQAIAQSHHITESYFFFINLVWRDALLDYLKNFRTYCQLELERTGTSPIFHYILPDGTEELLEVTPRMLEMQDIGLFLSNAGQDQQYHEIMLQLSHAFAQNAGEGVEAVSTIVKAITSGVSPEETHKLIQIESQKQQQRLQQLEETKAKAMQEAYAKEKEKIEDEQAHEVGIHAMDNASRERIAGINAQVKLQEKEEVPKEEEDKVDPIEVAKLQQEDKFRTRELELQEKKQQQDYELGKEKVAVDRKKASQPKTSNK